MRDLVSEGSVKDLADDGKPYVRPLQHFRDSQGDVYRVIYACGNLRAQITQYHGFCVISYGFIQGDVLGKTVEKRYLTWDNAYRCILRLRRQKLA